MESIQHCKTCGRILEKRQTKRTAAQFKKPYYYTAYYYCTHCQKIYHNDAFKVHNPQNLSLHMESLEEDTSPYDVEIWTDGACIYNGTPNAKAAWAFVSGKTEMAGKVIGKQTNNIAEGLAIYHALVWAAEQGHKKIKLYSDSQISLNNLKKDPIKVVANTEIFFDIADVVKKNNLKMYYEKVLGHSGDINNERVDKLANSLARS